MTETMFQDILSDLLTIGIVGGFVLMIAAKYFGKDIKEILIAIRDFLFGGKEDE